MEPEQVPDTQALPLRNNQHHLYISWSTIYMTDMRYDIHMEKNWYIYPLVTVRLAARSP